MTPAYRRIDPAEHAQRREARLRAPFIGDLWLLSPDRRSGLCVVPELHDQRGTEIRVVRGGRRLWRKLEPTVALAGYSPEIGTSLDARPAALAAYDRRHRRNRSNPCPWQ
jgi:hypothetical protein